MRRVFHSIHRNAYKQSIGSKECHLRIIADERLAIVVKSEFGDTILSKARKNSATTNKLTLVAECIARSTCRQATSDFIF